MSYDSLSEFVRYMPKKHKQALLESKKPIDFLVKHLGTFFYKYELFTPKDMTLPYDQEKSANGRIHKKTKQRKQEKIRRSVIFFFLIQKKHSNKMGTTKAKRKITITGMERIPT
jgi:16S rRNA C1402 (ribose-2'-O) methylase RsmI